MKPCPRTLAVVFSFLFFLLTPAWSQNKYIKLEDRSGVENGRKSWDSCVPCAGGASNNASLATSPFNSAPSSDGSSRDFYINGEAYSSGLWYQKIIGDDSNAKNFEFEFWINVAENTKAAIALEFDAFQFTGSRQFMFGTQCNYAAGVWDVWDSKNNDWHHTSVKCERFEPHRWYHVIMGFHRTDSDNLMHYDKLAIVKHDSNGNREWTKNYDFNRSYPGGKKPAGWADYIGVQFQMDIGSKGAEMQEWVDRVSLKAW